MRRSVAIVAAGLVFLLAACSSGSDEAGSTSAVAEDGGAAVPAEPAPAEESADGGDLAGSTGTGERVQVPPLPGSGTGDRVIKDGTIALEVGDGDFDRAYAEVVEVASRLGGGVVSSTTRTLEDGSGTSGSVTVRVPADEYEDLLVGMADIGEVRRRDVTASDVSTEFVDLQARQRNLEAQERFYLDLLGRAQGVPDAISIQTQLNGITEQLEQVKGRIEYLDDRTSFSTLTVELFEPGTALPALGDDGRPSFARFWELTRDAFVNVVGATLVALGFLAPVAIVGLVVAMAMRLMSRRTPPVPAAGQPERERETVA